MTSESSKVLIDSLFLFAISCHASLLSLVPVPLRDLVWRHAYLRCDLHLGGVGPVWIPIEILLQYSHLDRFFAHASALLPVIHVVLV